MTLTTLPPSAAMWSSWSRSRTGSSRTVWTAYCLRVIPTLLRARVSSAARLWERPGCACLDGQGSGGYDRRVNRNATASRMRYVRPPQQSIEQASNMHLDDSLVEPWPVEWESVRAKNLGSRLRASGGTFLFSKGFGGGSGSDAQKRGREPNEATRTAKCNHPRLTGCTSTGADAQAGPAGVSIIQLLTPALVSEEA